MLCALFLLGGFFSFLPKKFDEVSELSSNQLSTHSINLSMTDFVKRKERKRKIMKSNTPEEVFVDGQWMEVDRELTFQIWGETFYMGYDERQRIRDLKRKCIQRSKRTGIKHNLDHIQPLIKGGLHKSWNLQIVTEEQNLKKGDEFSLEDQKLLAWRLLIK